MNFPRPHGSIKAWKDGHVFFPTHIMEELGIRGDLRVPYFIGARTVLLMKQKTNFRELIADLDFLRTIVIRRAGEIEEPRSGTRQTEAAPGTPQRNEPTGVCNSEF